MGIEIEELSEEEKKANEKALLDKVRKALPLPPIDPHPVAPGRLKEPLPGPEPEPDSVIDEAIRQLSRAGKSAEEMEDEESQNALRALIRLNHFKKLEDARVAGAKERKPHPKASEVGLLFATGGLSNLIFGTSGKGRASDKEVAEAKANVLREWERVQTEAAKARVAKAAKAVKTLSEKGQGDLGIIWGATINKKYFKPVEWGVVNPHSQENIELFARVTAPNPTPADMAQLRWKAEIAKRGEDARKAETGKRAEVSEEVATNVGEAAYNAVTGRINWPPRFDENFPVGTLRRQQAELAAGEMKVSLSRELDQQIRTNKPYGMKKFQSIMRAKGDPLFDRAKWLEESPDVQRMYFSDRGIAMLDDRSDTLEGYVARFGKPATHDAGLYLQQAELTRAIISNQNKLNPPKLTKEQREAGVKPPKPLDAKARTRILAATAKLKNTLSLVLDESAGNYSAMKLLIKGYDAEQAAGRSVADAAWKADRLVGSKAYMEFRKLVRPDDSDLSKGTERPFDENEVVSIRNEDGKWIDPRTKELEPDDKPWTLYDKTYFEWIPHPGKAGEKIGFRAVKEEFYPWLDTFREIVPQFIGGGVDAQKFFDLGKTSLRRSNLYLEKKKEFPTTVPPTPTTDVPPDPRVVPPDTGLGEPLHTRNPEMISQKMEEEIKRVRGEYVPRGWGLIIKDAGGAKKYVDAVFATDKQRDVVKELNPEEKKLFMVAAGMEGWGEDRKTEEMKRVLIEMLEGRLIPESRRR